MAIETPPRISADDLQLARILLTENEEFRSRTEQCVEGYDYWSKLKYKVPNGIAPQVLWAAVKDMRNMGSKIDISAFGVHFSMTRSMMSVLHDIDMKAGGALTSSYDLREADKFRYVLMSVTEDEAFTSSSIEGASTTRRVAVQMLRENRRPKDRSERMIANNFAAINLIYDFVDCDLSVSLIKKIHATITDGTLDDGAAAGEFRKNDEVVVANAITNEIVHRPPSFTEIECVMRSLCDFVNNRGGGRFLHPVIKAIIAHYVIAYVHPFVDGNGRTARALFYWCMAKYGYWITKYISISTIIGMSKKSYENAYQYSAADGGDIGYFIQYNLEVISKAVERLTLYLHKKAGEAYNERQNIRKSLNPRQLMAYDYLKSGAVVSVTAKEIASKCGVSIPTATKDLNHMVGLGLIEKVKTFGMGYVYILHDE